MAKAPPLPPQVRARLKPYRLPKRRQDEIFDTGGTKATQIRVERGDVVEAEIRDPVMTRTQRRGNEVSVLPVYNKAHRVQSRLEIMARRKEITDRERKAGERFALDVEQSNASVKSCMVFEPGGGNPELAMLHNSTAMASWRVSRAMSAMGLAAWPLVVWVAVDGRPASEWAEERGYKGRSGVDMLRNALDALAEHYGM
jgi:hypothetical protein